MRIIFIILLFCSAQLHAQNKIYDIEMQTIDSNKISLKEYAGNKLLIVATSLEQLAKGELNVLDSLQDKYPAVKVMVIPSHKSVAEQNSKIVQDIKDDKQKHTLVFTPSKFEEEKTVVQNSLMNYLTSVKENGHFEVDPSSDFLMFIVSESGFLYAVLDRFVSEEVLDKLLTQKDVTE